MPINNDDFELQPIDGSYTSHINPATRPDSGKAANLVLLGCSLLQLPIWGFIISYGVLQQTYTTSLSLSGSPTLTGAIGTTQNGLLYMSLPLLSTLLSSPSYTHYRLHSTLLGLFLSSVGLILSASSTAVWHLLVTQGILCGLGSALVYSPTTLYLDEWFLQRKSYAYSVLLSVKNVVGTGTPFITPALVDGVGLQNTLRIWGGITAAGVLAVPLLRSRLGGERCGFFTRHRGAALTATDVDAAAATAPNASPTSDPDAESPSPSDNPHTSRRISFSFLTHKTFYIFLLANIIFSSGYGLPQTYIPSFASQILSLPSPQPALMLAFFNFPGIFSCIAFGMLGDGVRILGPLTPRSPYTVTFLSAIGSAAAVFGLWGFAATAGSGDEGGGLGGAIGLGAFSVVYGFFAGAYSSTWGGAMREMQREAARWNEAVDTGVVYGLMNGGRGIGYVVGGILGLALVDKGAVGNGGGEGKGWGYGTEYGSVIVYTGISAVIGGWSILWSLDGGWRRVGRAVKEVRGWFFGSGR